MPVAYHGTTRQAPCANAGGRAAKDRKISAANLVQAAQAMGFCRALLPRVDSELREILAAARPDDRWAERQTIYSFVV